MNMLRVGITGLTMGSNKPPTDSTNIRVAMQHDFSTALN